jgi:hypothetical protein
MLFLRLLRVASGPRRCRGSVERRPQMRSRAPRLEGDDERDRGDDAAEDLERRLQAKPADEQAREYRRHEAGQVGDQ